MANLKARGHQNELPNQTTSNSGDKVVQFGIWKIDVAIYIKKALL